MDKEIQIITGYLDKIAAKIGVGAHKIWPWLVKQQYIEAIYPAIIALVLLVATAVSFSWFKRETLAYEVKKEKDRYNADESLKITSAIVSVVFAIAFFAASIVFIVEFQDVFNAQYWALKDLLLQLKP
jgi:hypothetical protein